MHIALGVLHGVACYCSSYLHCMKTVTDNSYYPLAADVGSVIRQISGLHKSPGEGQQGYVIEVRERWKVEIQARENR